MPCALSLIGGAGMTKAAPRRQFKEDRLTNRGSSPEEIQCDMALGPLTAATDAMDRKWGVNRLPNLVSIETAQKFGYSCGKLNAAVDAISPADVAAWAGVCIRGLAAMDAEAVATKAPRANPEIWQMETASGTVCLIRDAAMWPAAQAANPGAIIVTLREVANALDAYQSAMPMIAAVKSAFPGAQITAIRKRTELEESLNDELPY